MLVQAVGGPTLEQALLTSDDGIPLVVLGAPLTIDADAFKAAAGGRRCGIAPELRPRVWVWGRRAAGAGVTATRRCCARPAQLRRATGRPGEICDLLTPQHRAGHTANTGRRTWPRPPGLDGPQPTTSATERPLASRRGICSAPFPTQEALLAHLREPTAAPHAWTAAHSWPISGPSRSTIRAAHQALHGDRSIAFARVHGA